MKKSRKIKSTRRVKENAVGDPGQFKTTPVTGFTPIDHTPTPPPLEKNLPARRSPGSRLTAEKKQLKRVIRHHRKGVE